MSWSDLVLGINRCINRWRRVRVPAGQILLLIPHCLHRKSCVRQVETDLNECAKCGQCNIADILRLRDEYGVQCQLAGGGRQAVALVRNPSVKVVIAIACEKELGAGILCVLPKPVIPVTNQRPEGFCKNTAVDIAAVRAAIESVLLR